MTSFFGAVARCRLLESLAVTKRIVFIPWLAARKDDCSSGKLNIDPEVFDVRTTLYPAEKLAKPVPIADNVDFAELEIDESITACGLLTLDG